jgi:uncharacterized protein YraI
MSRRYRLIVLVALLVVALMAATVVSAQTGVQVTTRDNVQLRSGPGTSFESFGTVPFNTTLPALGRNEDGSWIQVDYNGTIGWIVAYMLNLQGDVNALPVGGGAVPQPPTEEPTAEAPMTDQPTPEAPGAPAGPISATNTSVLNVRSGPTTGDAVLGQLPAGSTIIPTGRIGTGSQMWVRFMFEGQPEAWVAGWLLTFTGDPNTLPDIEAERAALAAALAQAEAALTAYCANVVPVDVVPVYDGGPTFHPILLQTTAGTPHWWATQVPSWAPATVLDTQLVACIGDQQERLIETCEYESYSGGWAPPIRRYVYDVTVQLFSPQNGAMVASTTISGAEPRACGPSEPWNLTRLAGPQVQSSQVFDWLRPFVNPPSG